MHFPLWGLEQLLNWFPKMNQKTWCLEGRLKAGRSISGLQECEVGEGCSRLQTCQPVREIPTRCTQAPSTIPIPSALKYYWKILIVKTQDENWTTAFVVNYQLVNWWKPVENSILFLIFFNYFNLFGAIEITWKYILKLFFVNTLWVHKSKRFYLR